MTRGADRVGANGLKESQNTTVDMEIIPGNIGGKTVVAWESGKCVAKHDGFAFYDNLERKEVIYAFRREEKIT